MEQVKEIAKWVVVITASIVLADQVKTMIAKK